MSENKGQEVEKFVPASDEVFKLPLLSKLLNKTFFIERVEFDESSKGEYAVLDVKKELSQPKHDMFRTSAEALLTQLRAIRKVIIEKDKPVQVKLGEVKGEKWTYLSFVDF